MAQRQRDLHSLQNMGFDMAHSIIEQVYDVNGQDVDKTLDELLNMASDPLVKDSVESSLKKKANSNQDAENYRLQQEQELAFFRREKELVDKQQEKLRQEEEKRMLKEFESDSQEDLISSPQIPEQDPQKVQAQLDELRALHQRLREETEAQKKYLEQMKQQKEEAAAQQEQDSSMPDKEHLANAPPPKVCIYVKTEDAKNAVLKEETREIIRLLTDFGIERDEIQQMNVAYDFELMTYFKQRCGGGKLEYPLIFVYSTPVGSLEDLKSTIRTGKFASFIKDAKEKLEDDANKNDPEMQLSILDKCLNVGEYVVSGVSTVLFLPITVLTWPFRSAPPTNEKEEGDVDFEVIHTNWYWRHLNRTFRFKKDSFLRMHPSYNDIRAVHTYESIEKMTLVDPTNLLIEYNDGSSPDWIRCSSEKIQAIMLEIFNRSSRSIPFLDRSMMVH